MVLALGLVVLLTSLPIADKLNKSHETKTETERKTRSKKVDEHKERRKVAGCRIPVNTRSYSENDCSETLR